MEDSKGNEKALQIPKGTETGMIDYIKSVVSVVNLMTALSEDAGYFSGTKREEVNVSLTINIELAFLFSTAPLIDRYGYTLLFFCSVFGGEVSGS